MCALAESFVSGLEIFILSSTATSLTTAVGLGDIWLAICYVSMISCAQLVGL